jgi:hypothetical protein
MEYYCAEIFIEFCLMLLFRKNLLGKGPFIFPVLQPPYCRLMAAHGQTLFFSE